MIQSLRKKGTGHRTMNKKHIMTVSQTGSDLGRVSVENTEVGELKGEDRNILLYLT